MSMRVECVTYHIDKIVHCSSEQITHNEMIHPIFLENHSESFFVH